MSDGDRYGLVVLMILVVLLVAAMAVYEWWQAGRLEDLEERLAGLERRDRRAPRTTAGADGKVGGPKPDRANA